MVRRSLAQLQCLMSGVMQNLLSSSHVDRSVSPWLIVGIHRPLYVPYPHHSNRKVAKHLRKGLEPLFSKYKVRLRGTPVLCTSS